MYENIKRFIQNLSGYNKDIRLAVSYSGGADSGVLLYMMMNLFSEKLIYRPGIIYFNHNLRGKESKAESKFVDKICAAYGIKPVMIDLDVKSYSEKNGLTIETAARYLRYENYKLLSGQFDHIVQGHHSDDNAETVFFNIMRGAGLDGACGIKKIRDQFIRPLLDFSKRDILYFAKENKIEFIEDSTNKKTDYSRNKIRNLIFPLIEKELKRDIRNSLNNFSDRAKEAVDFVNGAAEPEFSKIVRIFKGFAIVKLIAFVCLKPAIKTAVLHRAMKNIGCQYNPDSIKTKIILDGISKGSKSVFETQDYSVTTHSNSILILNKKDFINPIDINLNEGRISHYFIDISKTKGNIRCEKIKQEDYFIPFGKGKGEKIGKVLSDKKIPSVLRKHLLCLKDDEKIIFVQGVGISDSVKTEAANSELRYINLKNDILKKLFK